MLDNTEKNRITHLVNAPSAGALLYQAFALSKELNEISATSYPPQALVIRDIFLSIVNFIKDELTEFLHTEQQVKAKHNTLAFGKFLSYAFSLRFIYRNLRALRASSTNHCPLGLQASILQLAKKHLGISADKITCLARTQPMYMATYSEPLKDLFRYHFDIGLISKILPDDDDMGGVILNPEIGNWDVDFILHTLWKHRSAQDSQPTGFTAPTRVAIISFAGLDDHDALLYPIFAHEIAHFIDFCTLQKHTHSKGIIEEEVVHIMQKHKLSSSELHEIKERLSVFIREIFADLLAARMMGFPYFIALAELLKTMEDWDGELLVLKEGYPNNHLRLALVLEQVLAPSGNSDIRSFLANNKSENPQVVDGLSYLIEEWERHLMELNQVANLNELISRPKWPKQEKDVDDILVQCLPRFLPKLMKLTDKIIPTKSRPECEKSIFDRIRLLRSGKPPYVNGDNSLKFHDIMFAGWAYQVVFGENKERDITNPGDKFEEYVSTCKLIVDALNMASQSV